MSLMAGSRHNLNFAVLLNVALTPVDPNSLVTCDEILRSVTSMNHPEQNLYILSKRHTFRFKKNNEEE